MSVMHAWKQRRERRRLERWPRYVPTTTTFFGKPFAMVDACTFLAGSEEIFGAGIYEFRSEAARPRILDCGANIGLSVLYFKTIHPGARVVAFEPDPAIFRVLEANVASFGLRDVELRQAAVWTENGSIEFKPEGGFSGRILPGAAGAVGVPSVRLRDWLDEPVDFLKIDIEGAEMDVLSDCADRLDNVKRLFIEYHAECGRPQRLDEMLAMVRRAGFRYQIHEAYVARKPFLERPPMMGMDLQLNLFCFREDAS